MLLLFHQTLINDRTDEPGAIVIYRMSFSAKIELFNNLGRSLEMACEATIPIFKILIGRLKKCATLRNAIVHAEWENMNEKGYTYVKMICNKNGVQQQYWQYTPESLEEIIEFIQETYSMFDQYENEKTDLFNK